VPKLGSAYKSGVEAFPGRLPNDLVLWIESQRALVVGDTLVDRGHGLEIPADWLPKDMTREQAVEALRPLLDLPVELVLPTHGAPTDRAALECARSPNARTRLAGRIVAGGLRRLLPAGG